MFATPSSIDLLIMVLVPCAIVLALMAWHRAGPLPRAATRPAADQSQSQLFEFSRSGDLVQCNKAARELLEALDPAISDWSGFRSTFLSRFDAMPASITPSDKSRVVTLASNSIADPVEMELERHPSGMTVLLHRRGTAQSTAAADLHRALCSLDNIELIRAASENAPFPIWHSLPGGAIGWTNARYRALDARIERPSLTASTPLFALPDEPHKGDKPMRISLKDEGHNRTYWFDVSQVPLERGMLNFAVDIHAMVNAEAAQRNFVQTLAKTFAHLSTGLAIFDRNRQLMLFNPALIDLTGLAPDFLSSRPILFSFFDHLRDAHIMPEPKDYSSWRERIAGVVTDASNDNFNETWHLANGLTYRVTGRPHPDGAIAFLFEDISAEISLTRRFRSESAITQSALDAMEDSVAIFNEAGFLVCANAAMKAQLDFDDTCEIESKTVQVVSALWQRRYKPSPIWGEIREFATGCTERATWSARIMSKQGQIFLVSVSPLVGGATMVRMIREAKGARKHAADVAA